VNFVVVQSVLKSSDQHLPSLDVSGRLLRFATSCDTVVTAPLSIHGRSRVVIAICWLVAAAVRLAWVGRDMQGLQQLASELQVRDVDTLSACGNRYHHLHIKCPTPEIGWLNEAELCRQGR
jgi:hypothetical protein